MAFDWLVQKVKEYSPSTEREETIDRIKRLNSKLEEVERMQNNFVTEKFTALINGVTSRVADAKKTIKTETDSLYYLKKTLEDALLVVNKGIEEVKEYFTKPWDPKEAFTDAGKPEEKVVIDEPVFRMDKEEEF